MTLYTLTGYANYANRTVKYHSDFAQYTSEAESFKEFVDINFKINDGITTEQVINLPIGTTNFNPDYLLVTEDIEAYPHIVSRWYIVESVETRALQYKLSLRRDVIADNYDLALDATSRINRGWCSSLNSAIYNPENISVNEKKISETLLKDKTGYGCVVGYVDNLDKDYEITVHTGLSPEPIEIQSLFVTHGGFAYESFDSSIMIHTYAKDHSEINKSWDIGFSAFDYKFEKVDTYIGDSPFTWREDVYDYNKATIEIAQALEKYAIEHKESVIDPLFFTIETQHELFNPIVEPYVGKIFSDAQGRTYRLTKKPNKTTKYGRVNLVDSYRSYILGAMTEAWRAQTESPKVLTLDTAEFSNLEYVDYNMIGYEYERDYNVNVGDIKTTLTKTTATPLIDAPYYMFCIPFDGNADDLMRWNQGADYGVFNITKTTAINIGTEISRQLGAHLLDMQILPYFPSPDSVERNTSNILVYDPQKENEAVESIVIHTGESVGVQIGGLIWCKHSQFTSYCEHTTFIPDDPLELKTYQIRYKRRIASPNYASMYEFSTAMNNGINGFKVDCSYMPYTPYIRVAPVFSGLYGSDFGDCRGLICRGDFSMPQINDSWTNYVNNNKNYAAIFDRNIDTLEFNRNMSLASSGIGLAASGITAAVTHNPTNLIGIGSQVANGIMNFASAQRAISDTQYLHNLEMENIQAQPNTISNVGTFTINNKIFPILELYSCTDEEVESVKTYLNNFSFTINRQGKIRDYMRSGVRTWIEADLIAVPDFKGDAHELMELKNELTKGVYIV